MADITVTVPDTAVARIRTAVGTAYRFGRAATAAEVAGACRAYLRSLCLQVEREARAAPITVDADAAVSVEFP